MAIQAEIWEKDIVSNLFKENPFLNYCYNADQYVVGGSVVHIPQAGAKPSVTKNRSSFPATAVRRTDTDITYALDVYSTDPTLITNAEEMEISYDKRQSVLEEHTQTLNETIGDEILYIWAPSVSGQIVRTTGGDVTAHVTSATGNRKKLLAADLKSAQKVMNKQNIPSRDRYAIIDAEMYDQLTSDSTLLTRDGVNGGELNMKDGVVLKLAGFEIMMRANVVRYTEASPPVKKTTSAAGASTDNGAALCWQKNSVERALGSVKFFENINDALHYGNVYSAEVKFGGRIRRSGQEGVVAIVQAAGS